MYAMKLWLVNNAVTPAQKRGQQDENGCDQRASVCSKFKRDDKDRIISPLIYFYDILRKIYLKKNIFLPYKKFSYLLRNYLINNKF